MKINKQLSRLGMAFMLTAIFSQFDVSEITLIAFCIGEAMFIISGGLSDMEDE